MAMRRRFVSLYKPTEEEVRDAARIVCAFRTSDLNARGYASADQVRARLVKRLGRVVDGEDVTRSMRAIFPKVDAHPGYYVIKEDVI